MKNYQLALLMVLLPFIICCQSREFDSGRKQTLNDLSVLREAGFFNDFVDLDLVQLYDTLHSLRIEEYSEIFNRFYDPGMDLEKIELASIDNKKTIFIDLEADVCRDNKIYIDVINMYNTISLNSFNPINIEEHWETDTGMIAVSFNLDNKKYKFNPEYMNDWLHESVFLKCEQLIKDEGEVRLVYCLSDDGLGYGQSVAIMRLTIAEQRVLEQEFGWKFE